MENKTILGIIGPILIILLIVSISGCTSYNDVAIVKPDNIEVSNAVFNNTTDTVSMTVKNTGSDVLRYVPVVFKIIQTQTNGSTMESVNDSAVILDLKPGENKNVSVTINYLKSQSETTSKKPEVTIFNTTHDVDYKILQSAGEALLNNTNNQSKESVSDNGAISIKGKLVSQAEVFEGAISPNAPATIIVSEKAPSKYVGKWVVTEYSSPGSSVNSYEVDGYQMGKTYYVIYWPELKIVAKHTIYGPEPPVEPKDYVGGNVYGDFPDPSDWIASLPRQT